MSIAKRLYYNFAAILGIASFLFVINIIAIQREHSARAETAASLDMALTADQVRLQMMENQLMLRSYLLSGVTSEIDDLNAGVARYKELLRKAEEKATTQDQKTPLSRLREAGQKWEDEFAKPMIEKRKQVDSGNATVAELQIFYLNQNPAAWVKSTGDLVQQVVDATSRNLEDRRKNDQLTSTITLVITIVGMVVVLGMGALIAFRTSKAITEPLEKLMGVAREIGDTGELEHKIDIDREDEIGELARTFNKMVGYLKEMAGASEAIAGGDLSGEVQPRSNRDTLGNAFVSMTEGLQALVASVRDSAAQVASGSNQVANASDETAKVSLQAASAIDEVTSTMHEMSINVQNMVKSTQVQASSVSETSASIDEMVASIQRVADTAKVLLDISNRSRQEVQAGIGSMEKTTEGLNRITDAIRVSSGIIDVLGQRADDIGKIIEVIDDISEQTNLLALNAAIEAARAGEHGLGFAVVADEVRKLAEKSAQSTKEISELIQSIQKEVRRAVENMDKSTTIVNEGLAFGNDLSSALRKISNVVTEVYKFAQEIGAATNEQSHGSSQIAKATTRLNEITHEINSSVEEQASGTQAVVKAMERMRELVQQSTSSSAELAASAEQMSKMSRSLLEAMDRFKLSADLRTPGGRKVMTARA